MWFEAASLLDKPGPYPLYWGVGLCLLFAACFLAVRAFHISPSARDYRAGFRSTACFASLVILCLLAFRLPSFLYLTELNVDESQLITNARKFLDNPIPWLSVDTTTSGPLNSYVLAIPALVSREYIGYASIRVTGAILLGAMLVFSYLTLRLLCGEGPARLAVLPSLAMLGMHQKHFLDYSTELFPIALLAAALYLVARFWRGWTSAYGAYLAGVMLGAAPFAKLQSGPLAVLIFGFALVVHELQRRARAAPLHAGAGEARPSPWPFRLWLAAGGATVPVLVASMIVAGGAWQDAWRSYILTPLFIGSRELNPEEFVEFLLNDRLFLRYVIVMLVAGGVPMVIVMFRRASPLRRTHELWLWAVVAYGLAALYCIWKGANPWDHYLLFLVHPLVLFTGLLWSRSLAQIDLPWNWKPGRILSVFGAGALLLLAMLFMRSWGRIEGKLVESGDTSADKVAQLVRKLAGNDRHMAVWGWMPVYYVKTGLNPSTRDVLTQFQIQKNPLKAYYVERYLRDFRSARPNVIVVATGPGNFNSYWDGDPRVTAVSELAEIIAKDFVLAYDLQECATPETQIYVSKARYAELDKDLAAQLGKKLCLN